MDQVIIWRLTWSHELGVYWLAIRSCPLDHARYWIDRHIRNDAQGVVYQASKRTPRLPDNAQQLARHAATY